MGLICKIFHHGTRWGRAGFAPESHGPDEREDVDRLRQAYKLLGRAGMQGRQSVVDRLAERTALDVTKAGESTTPPVFVRVRTSASVERVVEPVRLQVPREAQWGPLPKFMY